MFLMKRRFCPDGFPGHSSPRRKATSNEFFQRTRPDGQVCEFESTKAVRWNVRVLLNTPSIAAAAISDNPARLVRSCRNQCHSRSVKSFADREIQNLSSTDSFWHRRFIFDRRNGVSWLALRNKPSARGTATSRISETLLSGVGMRAPGKN